MKYLLYAALALALGSCGGSDATKPANLLASNDFESLDGWLGGEVGPSLTKEQAHSGVYSVKVDPKVDYSMGYSNPLGRLSSSRITKLKLHGWVFLPSDQAGAQLIIQLLNPNDPKPLVYDGLDLLNEGKAKGYNKWIEFEHVVPIPEAATYNSQLKIYLWKAASAQPVYLDDLQLERQD